MIEFTKEWIEEQKKLLNRISPLPWKACDCGKCGQVSNKIDCVAKATIGDWGDDYPSIRRIGGSIEGRFETYMEQITYGSVSKDEGIANAKYIAEACNNYPKAIDEILRLQSRVQELEESLHDQIKEDADRIAYRDKRIVELEAELMFYQMECPDLIGRYQPQKEE